MKQFRESFVRNVAAWKEFYDSSNPHELEFPQPMNRVGSLQKLVALRCVRPDKVVPAVAVNKKKIKNIFFQFPFVLVVSFSIFSLYDVPTFSSRETKRT